MYTITTSSSSSSINLNTSSNSSNVLGPSHEVPRLPQPQLSYDVRKQCLRIGVKHIS